MNNDIKNLETHVFQTASSVSSVVEGLKDVKSQIEQFPNQIKAEVSNGLNSASIIAAINNDESEVKIKGLPVVKFDGVKMVDISLISVSDKALASPNHKHIEYFENIFKKTGKVEPPLTVSCNGSYYLIEDGNSRFFAALNLGFTKVPIEIGTRENNDIKKRLKIGTKIRYGSYGEGVIIEIKDKFMKIKFSNYETSLDMDLAIKSNMLKIL